MPGIFGKTINTEQNNLDLFETLFIHMEALYHKRQDFKGKYFINSLVYFDFQDQYPFHFVSEKLEIWIYGDPLIDGLTGVAAMERTMSLVENSYPDISKLSRVDGLFSIIINDKTANKLYLINDRNGLAHLYYGVFKDQLIWGSELRFFINKQQETTINTESLMDFLNLGYHIADATWFNEVKLLPPASYLVWDLESSGILELSTYWSHKNLSKNSITGSKQEIISTLNKLFKQAVEKRVGSQEQVGITLSGGLDSRLIFANIPFQEKKFTAITRGRKNAGDIKLAKQVVSLRKDCQHIIKSMDASNWLDGRINALVTTSGQKNLFDMNAMSSLPLHKTYFDINLDGAGGDGIFTGGHLQYENKKDLDVAFREKYYKNIFGNEKESLSRFVAYYKTIDSDQHFYIHERIRRFVVFGSILGHDYGIITRFPFLDHQLQDYFYQLDKKHNANDLYYKMLVKYYPDYFVKIDSLTSGTRLYGSTTLNFIAKAKSRIQERLGFKKYLRSYHNYSKWIIEENKALLDDYILSEDLYLYNFVSYSDTTRVVEIFFETGKKASLISRILSLSVFLEDYKEVLDNK